MRYALAPDSAMRFIISSLKTPNSHQLVAPSLLRSDVLNQLFDDVRSGKLDMSTAKKHQVFFRTLKIRLLGDRVLHQWAWQIAHEQNQINCQYAEYVAAAKLQADILISDDPKMIELARPYTPVGGFNQLFA